MNKNKNNNNDNDDDTNDDDNNVMGGTMLLKNHHHHYQQRNMNDSYSMKNQTTTKTTKIHMPRVGLGVALSFDDTYRSVQTALNVGYRLIDTAADDTYDNQDIVGLAVHHWLNYYDDNNTNDDEDDQYDKNERMRQEQQRQRSDVWITTKLWDDSHGFYHAIRAFYLSLHELRYMDYIDLYLIHSPFGGYLIETWDALLYLQQQQAEQDFGINFVQQQQQQQQDVPSQSSPSKTSTEIPHAAMSSSSSSSSLSIPVVRAIGVSNFGISHLQALLDAGRPLPSINQIEMHPLIYQQRLPLMQFCHQHNIRIQAYGSIKVLTIFDQIITTRTTTTKTSVDTTATKTDGNDNNNNDNDNNNNHEDNDDNDTIVWLTELSLSLQDMAQRYDTTQAQILLKWAWQHDFAIIPKSTNSDRIRDNIQLLHTFTISEIDMMTLDHWGCRRRHHHHGRHHHEVEEEENKSDDNSPSSCYGKEGFVLYKDDWNWNPIDEAPVHLGRSNSFWAQNFSDVNMNIIRQVQQQQGQEEDDLDNDPEYDNYNDDEYDYYYNDYFEDDNEWDDDEEEEIEDTFQQEL